MDDLMFFILLHPNFLKTTFSTQTSGTFGFAQKNKANATAKPNEPLFANAST
jgi:hypothetical protein